MDEFEKRTDKILARIEELATFSEDVKLLTRTFGSAAFIDASQKVFAWMKDAGLETSIDNIGNIRGRLRATVENAKTFVIASHIDTVVNAGKFDGPLGVIMGLDLIENIIKSKLSIPFDIELIAFSDEEGVRFHSTFLGSKVVAGSFDNSLLDRKDATGTSVQQVIKLLGGDAAKLNGDVIAAKNICGYFEIHIEQGPVLYEKDLPAALVTSIAGQRRVELVFKGFAGHAGTVPMDMRSDALCAAAECVLQIESFAISRKDEIVATVGKLDIQNAASNVIPGDVVCSLDIRSADDLVLETAAKSLRQTCETACKKRNIVFEWKQVQHTKPVACDKYMNQLLAASIEEAGYETISLVSGAGHDAVPMSEISPVAMLFVRCFKGISHNPLENAEPKDINASLQVAEKFLYKLISKSKP